MMADLIACYNIARKKSYGKAKSRGIEILKETHKLWLQRCPCKAVSLMSIRFQLSTNATVNQFMKKDRKSKELTKKPKQDPKADAHNQFASVKRGTSSKKNKPSNKHNNDQPENNLTTDPERLRKVKLANEKFAIKTIFAHVCYNCGNMMIKTRTMVFSSLILRIWKMRKQQPKPFSQTYQIDYSRTDKATYYHAKIVRKAQANSTTVQIPRLEHNTFQKLSKLLPNLTS